MIIAQQTADGIERRVRARFGTQGVEVLRYAFPEVWSASAPAGEDVRRDGAQERNDREAERHPAERLAGDDSENQNSNAE